MQAANLAPYGLAIAAIGALLKFLVFRQDAAEGNVKTAIDLRREAIADNAELRAQSDAFAAQAHALGVLSDDLAARVIRLEKQLRELGVEPTP